MPDGSASPRCAVARWIIRAVYEKFAGLRRFAVRPSDRWGASVSDEDIDEMVGDIATRAMRSMDDSERNPMFGKVETLRDLVVFLDRQPCLRCDMEAGCVAGPDEIRVRADDPPPPPDHETGSTR